MAIQKIIGRAEESKFLERIWLSSMAEFIAVYGRRRVGKTHLIREFFSKKGCYFELSGLKDGNMQAQLLNFSTACAKTFYPGTVLPPPKDWYAAFALLTNCISQLPTKKKVTIFLDELPWLATKRSHLMQQLDYFWNTQWVQMPQIKLIVCGSAAAWMLDKLINAKGGLHNRLTQTLLLQPYQLNQTKAFLAAQGIKFSNKQLLDIYTITGGIPHYLKRIQKSKSAVQNINSLCFAPDGLLLDEFPRLFASLFDHATLNLKMIEIIAAYRYGLSIQDISQKIGKKTGGTLTKRLNELEAAGFVQKYRPYGKQKRNHYYRVIDEYSYFYLAWIKPYKALGSINIQSNYWQLATKTPAWQSWAGYAFESFCYKHIDKIRAALKLDQIHCKIGNWRYIPEKKTPHTGAQIDLIIERDDGIVTLCEIKYSQKKITIDKACAQNLMNKIQAYQRQFPTTAHISVAIITSYGVKSNLWSKEMIDQVVTLDDLL